MVSKLLSKFQDHKRDVPLLRGRIHYLSLCLHPILLKNLKNDSIPQEIKSSILIFFLCFVLNFISTTLLHNNQTYIYRSAYKRIDIASIFLIISSNSLPISVYYMKYDMLLATLISIQWILTFIGVFVSLVFDFCCCTKEFRSLLHFIINIPSSYLLYRVYVSGPRIALIGMLMGYVFNILGAFVYCKEGPVLLVGILEDHELFHIFCMLGLYSIITVNDFIINSAYC